MDPMLFDLHYPFSTAEEGRKRGRKTKRKKGKKKKKRRTAPARTSSRLIISTKGEKKSQKKRRDEKKRKRGGEKRIFFMLLDLSFKSGWKQEEGGGWRSGKKRGGEGTALTHFRSIPSVCEEEREE